MVANVQAQYIHCGGGSTSNGGGIMCYYYCGTAIFPKFVTSLPKLTYEIHNWDRTGVSFFV